MYRDFTNSAEAMRRERYRNASTTSSLGRGLRTRIGSVLMRMGQHLAEAPHVKTDIEAASA